MSTKHTQGEWTTQEQDGRFFVVTPEKTLIATIIRLNQFGLPMKSGVATKEEAEANANLIAVSPKMLKALDMLIEFCAPDNVDLDKGHIGGYITGRYADSKLEFDLKDVLLEALKATKQARGEQI